MHPSSVEINLPPEPIDLPALVIAVLDGALGDAPLIQLSTFNGACDAVVDVVASKIGRPLRDHERAKVFVETGCEFNRRRHEKREQLRQTQERLHNPMLFIGRAS